MKNEFKPLTKKERVETYGGFAWLLALPAIAAITQTVVSCGIAIYQAVKEKSGSVSFGGSKTITQKYPTESKTKYTSAKTKTTHVTTFSAY